MRHKGYRITRYADDWLATCRTRQEAESVLQTAQKVLTTLGVKLNLEKTRIVHVNTGFEFLGYKIKRGQRPLQLSQQKIRSGVRQGNLYAYPRQKSIDKFKEEIRARTQRNLPLSVEELIEGLNPVIRGWGNYYSRAQVRRLFNQLDRWIVRRIWSQHYKHWRNQGWKKWPAKRLYGELGLVSLIHLIPSLKPN